jgi:hypothetical protein
VVGPRAALAGVKPNISALARAVASPIVFKSRAIGAD